MIASVPVLQVINGPSTEGRLAIEQALPLEKLAKLTQKIFAFCHALVRQNIDDVCSYLPGAEVAPVRSNIKCFWSISKCDVGLYDYVSTLLTGVPGSLHPSGLHRCFN